MMNNVIINVGISGSGKSTWTTNFLKENPNYLRINRDQIRLTLVGDLDGYYSRKDLNSIEKIVSHIEKSIYCEISLVERSVIIDNTNLKESYITPWIESSKSFNQEVKFKLFDCDLEEAMERVALRDFGPVPRGNPWSLSDYHYGKLEYIEKQFEDYQRIKEFIQKNYKDKII